VGKDVVIRFAVGDPLGRCSGNWRLWAEGRAGEVYVANRMVADKLKVSLHSSGIYREAFTEAYTAALGLPANERARLEWRRLEPEHGWIYAYRIHIPASELRPVDPTTKPSKRQIYWHPAPAQDDRTTEYTVLIGPHELKQEGFPGGNVGALFLMGLTAANGDRVALMVHESKATRRSRVSLERARKDHVEWMLREGRTGWCNQRALLPAIDRHGVGNVVELALPDYSDLPKAYVRRHSKNR
jgi:hypothetical protein